MLALERQHVSKVGMSDRKIGVEPNGLPSEPMCAFEGSGAATIFIHRLDRSNQVGIRKNGIGPSIVRVESDGALEETARFIEVGGRVERRRPSVQQLRRAGKYAEGIPLAEQYLALAKSRHGEEHPKYASGLHDLGVLYRHQCRYAEAEPLLTRALVIAEKAEGPDHLHVGIALNSLALLYQVQRRFAEAEPLLQRALAIGEKALGPDHPTVGARLDGLAGFIKRSSVLMSSFSSARSRSRKKRGVRTPRCGTVAQQPSHALCIPTSLCGSLAASSARARDLGKGRGPQSPGLDRGPPQEPGRALPGKRPQVQPPNW